MSRRFRIAVVTASLVGGIGLPQLPANAAGSTLAGRVFQDLNRDGAWQSSEVGFAGLTLYLMPSDRSRVLAAATTATDGTYSFGALADGSYVVTLEDGSWRSIRNDWAPTSVAVTDPYFPATVSGSSSLLLPWRPIVRSTDIAAPLNTTTTVGGVRIAVYNDAVAPTDVARRLGLGTLFGSEQPATTIRLDLGSANYTAMGADGQPGSYSGYTANVYLNWDAWLDHAECTLFHEYGHAWSGYYSYIAQQDPGLSGYLAARGVSGDPRLGSSHMWSPNEMIAEDYRQLFGSPTARTYPQENYELPAAQDVAGLADYLSRTFMTPPGGTQQPASGTSSSPAPSPAPAPAALAVTTPTVSPAPVKSTATVATSVNQSVSSLTITVVDSTGRAVKTLYSAAASGSVSRSWDRTDANGRRVKTGTYTAVVVATSSTATARASSSFSVS